MSKPTIIGAIVFTILTILFFVLQAHEKDGTEQWLLYVNIAVGCLIKAIGLWISFPLENKHKRDALCLGVSSFAAGIWLLLLFTTLGGATTLRGAATGLFFLLVSGGGVMIVSLLDLFIYIFGKFLNRIKNKH